MGIAFIQKARAISCIELSVYIMLANPDIALALSARRGMRGRASLRPPRTISPVAELGNSAVPRKDFNFRTIQIIPSVLPADWANMGHCVKELETAGVDRIQFDVMDGNFVPNLTFGPEMIKACRKYCNVPFETQLMVSQYSSEAMLDKYVEASKGPNGECGVVIVHVEACDHLHRMLARIRILGGSPSVALNPHTPAEMVENVLDLVDHVLVMTVNPGFGGQAYIPTMLRRSRRSVSGVWTAGWISTSRWTAGSRRIGPSPSVRTPGRIASSPGRACSRTTTCRRVAKPCARLRRQHRTVTSWRSRRNFPLKLVYPMMKQ